MFLVKQLNIITLKILYYLYYIKNLYLSFIFRAYISVIRYKKTHIYKKLSKNSFHKIKYTF